jgi:hypothetical protein
MAPESIRNAKAMMAAQKAIQIFCNTLPVWKTMASVLKKNIKEQKKYNKINIESVKTIDKRFFKILTYYSEVLEIVLWVVRLPPWGYKSVIKWKMKGKGAT